MWQWLDLLNTSFNDEYIWFFSLTRYITGVQHIVIILLSSLHVFFKKCHSVIFSESLSQLHLRWGSMIIQDRTLITQLKPPLLYLLLFISNHAGCSKASVYGSNCDTPCPENCKGSTCHIRSGSCFNCKPGWSGMYCNTSKMICVPRNNFTINYL